MTCERERVSAIRLPNMIPTRRDSSRAAAALGTAALAAVLAACVPHSRAAPPRATVSADVYERSTHRLARIPSDAAACIAERARTSGHAADTVPLYGLESVAVTVKTGVVGDMLAVLSLTRSDAGTVAAATTWKDAKRDREAFVRDLVQGC